MGLFSFEVGALVDLTLPVQQGHPQQPPEIAPSRGENKTDTGFWVRIMEDLGNSCSLCSVFASDSKKVLGGAPRGTNVRRQNGIAKRDRTWRDQGSRVGQFSKIFLSSQLCLHIIVCMDVWSK